MVLGWSFFGSFVFKSLCGYAPGLLQDWHIFYWFYSWGWNGAIAGEAWGWVIELTPAFWGAGMLSGLNASWSFFGGTVLAWGILGPITIAKGWTISKPNGFDVEDPLWRNYFSMSAKDYINGSSPRYWMLWPGIMIMLCYVSRLFTPIGSKLTVESISRLPSFASTSLSSSDRSSSSAALLHIRIAHGQHPARD